MIFFIITFYSVSVVKVATKCFDVVLVISVNRILCNIVAFILTFNTFRVVGIHENATPSFWYHAEADSYAPFVRCIVVFISPTWKCLYGVADPDLELGKGCISLEPYTGTTASTTMMLQRFSNPGSWHLCCVCLTSEP